MGYRVKITSHMTFGCSHTANPDLPKKHHWVSVLERETGVRFTAYSQLGAGLLHLISYIGKDYNEEEAKAVKCVILQKPQSFRFPWWHGYDFNRFIPKLQKRFSKRGWQYLPKKGVYWQSCRRYDKLSKKKAKVVAQNLLDVDVQMLQVFVGYFPNAKLAYYHYWIDNLLMEVLRPPLVDNNIKLGCVAEKLGMTNWDVIVDPKTIKGTYDKGGKIILDKKQLFKSKYILSPKDLHPGKKYQQIVASHVGRWLK